MKIKGKKCDICERIYDSSHAHDAKIEYYKGSIKGHDWSWIWDIDTVWFYHKLDVCPVCFENMVNYCQKEISKKNEKISGRDKD